MHGLRSLPGALRRKLRDERGWALVDAVASSAVVVLAFVGTTMAFNGSEASVARDQKKSQAMIVAQGQLSQMRSIAQRDVNKVVDDAANGNGGWNGKTATVTYQGVDYTVESAAYYVTGMGNDQQNACEVAYQSGGGGARYIYMRVKVSYDGQIVGQSDASNPYITAPASLDTYYAPEANGTQANTGTLRVYILDRDDNVATGISTVKLFDPSTNTERNPSEAVASTGCYLFTGLARNTYQVRANVSSSRQDVYLSNSPSTNKVTMQVVMPDRGALSREIRLAAPATVVPKFYVQTVSNPKEEITFVSGQNNPWFGGSSSRPGNWIAASDQIRTAPNEDFSNVPSGISFMPHQRTLTQSTLPNAIFPLKNGYDGFAGPCDANDPNAGAAEGVNNLAAIPPSLTDPRWTTGTGGAINPELWLSQIRPSYSTFVPSSKPTSGIINGTSYYWGQTLASGQGVKVAVRQEADAEGGTKTPRCRYGFTSFNTWVTLPGSLTSTSARLSDEATALPTGTYDVCFSVPVTYSTATGRTSTTLNSTSTLTKTFTYTFTVDPDDSEPDIPALTYKSAFSVVMPAQWSSNRQEAPNGAGTTCAG